MGESPDGIQQLNSYVVSTRDSSMRTKVEKSCKKAPQQKLNFNLASPKVVLNADDCARFLDNMGKASLLLAEKEDKMLAATSKLSSAQPTTSSSSLLSLAAPPPCSPPTSSSSSTSLTIPCSPASSVSPFQNFIAAPGAASQTQICRNWNSESTTKSTETTEHVETGHIEKQKAADMNSNNSSHQVVSTQTPSILKPPKKRRGHEKKLEEITHSSPIFNNGDVHPPIPTSSELGDSDSFQGSKDPSSLNLSLDASRKHSVHNLLQHQSESLVFVKNSPVQTPDFHTHDSRSYPLAQIDLPLSSLTTASCIMSPPSLSSSDTSNVLSCVPQPQLLTHLYTSGPLLKNQPCPDEMSTALSHPQPVPGNTITSQPGSFQHLPEQLEPMNLSTSCNLDAGPPSLQVSSSLEQTAPENVSSASPPQLLVAHDTRESLSTHSDHSSEISKQMSVEKMTLSETAEPEYSPCVASMQPATHSLHNGLSDCVSERGAFQAPISSKPLSSMDESSRTSFTVSKDATHEASISMNPVTDLADSKATSVVEVSSQSPPTDVSSQTLHLESVTGTCPQSFQESTTAGDTKVTNVHIKIPNTAGTENVLKVKRPPKKRVEIPMDEVSCADRLHRYSLTVDDVIANFVYIPEPVEEFCLTKEEAAIIAHSENVYDCCISDLTDVCTNNNKVMGPLALGAESQPVAQNGHDKPHVHAEIASIVKPIKKRPAAVLEHNQASSSDQDVQKIVENISSIIAFVAGNCSDSVSSLSDGCSQSLNIKSKKKVVKKAADVVKNKEVIQRKRLKTGVNNVLPSDKELETSAGENQERKDQMDAGMLKEETEKVSKPKKRNSSIKAVDKTDPSLQHTTEAGGMTKEETMKSVTKKLVKKAKTPKGKKMSNEQTDLCVDSISHSAHAGDKETANSNRAETSDIGESIASTSGGSEQDTPVHEPESKDDMASTDPQTTDRENHDTGLESGGDDKPVRRYKKRLDFVKCEQCEHRARGRSALSRHMKKVHKVDVNMPFKCEHCGYGCTKMASLNRHLFTHGVYPCSRCSFVADERIRLAEHTIDQHKDKLEVKMCKICNRYIKCNMITIEQHIQECKGPAPFRCTECEKEFKYASSLRVHYHSHFPDQPKKFKCEFCEYRTNYKANLHKHHKNMHASKDRDVQCPECGKLFSAEDNMRRHRKVHTLIRPFSCQTCEKTFKTPAALKGHQLIHNAIRPYTCNIPGCNRNFRTPKFLKSHQEEFHRLVPKKFFCTVEGCSYSFFKRSHLKRHAITHTGERNFHCTWPGCNKSFRHADNLKVHFRSHTNEKPVQCHLCDFKCKQKNSLFWHKKRVHQIVDVSACPGREYKLKVPMVYDAASKTVDDKKMDDGKDEIPKECQENGAENIHVTSSMVETSMKILNEDESSVKANVVEILPVKSEIEKQARDFVETKPELSHSFVIGQIVTQDSNTRQDQEGLGPHDLYEFKSEDESEEEKPGNFRRDKALMNVLAPLPPPPKELLRKNEIQEMKEKEKKEKAERKEQEKKEKAERKEQKLKEKAERKSLEKIAKAERKSLEKKKKLEKKELEKKEKVEKKEIEKKEKIEKKEQEKKEKAEKKELERKEKLERKELEKQEKIEKKQQEKKEKAEKKQQEKKEIVEKREREKQEKAEKKLVEKSLKEKKNEQETSASSDENVKNEKPLSKSPIKSLKRRKSAASPVKVDSSAFVQKPKRSRRLQEDQPVQPSDIEPHSFRSRKDKEFSASLLKKKMVSPTKVGEMTQTSATTSSLSTRSVTNRSPVLRKSVIVRGRKKGKLTPPKRKPSARIKAKKKAKALKAKTVGKVKKASSSGFKRKYLRRKPVAIVSEAEKAEEEALKADSVEVNLDDHSVKNVEENHDSSGENEVALKSDQVETMVVPQRSSSPAGSDDVMLQGKASPYRDFSDHENPEEEVEKPTSPFLKEQMKSPLAQDRSEAEVDLMLDEKTGCCVVDKHAVHPTEEYSDDEVSNDIPLTPPRAPAPPPVESSEDEMEPEPEPTPISVLGPNTPFSVPGPNTPFSVPPPTNLMQQHSVHSEEAPMSVVPSVPSMEMHSQSSVDMPQPVGSVEMHPHGSVEMNCHSQGSVEMSHQHTMVEMRSHNSVEIRSHGSVEMMQSHGSVEMPHHGSISESVHNSEHGVKSPASVIRDMTDKFELPQSFQEQAQASEADKEYFDQYLKSWSATNNRAANGCLDSSLTGLQHLEAMVSKSHHDSREISSKSPISSLPTSVITSLESTLPLLTHGELRARMDALVSDRHRESLYTRDTPSSLARLPDRQTPLPPSAAGHSPAFDAFTSLNPLHSAATGSGRENSYLRQPENLFPTPPGSSSFMAEAMFQRQTMTTPFLPPQPSDRSSMSRIPDTTPLRSSSSSSLLRRPGTVHNSDMFSPPSMAQTMPRHPFANAWASQEVRPAHWQTPYLPHQSSMAAAGSFFPPKDSYLTGREFMFDPSVRPAAERSMFSSLPSSQSQDSFQLDRFDLSNYFPNAMTPYGSSSSSLEYSRSAHTAAAKPFDDRYRQTTSASIHDFRGLPPTGASTDMFPTLPGVNTSFNLYPGNPMSYHTQHMSDNVNTAFLAHPSSAQHPMFDRDYAAAAAHRGLYPQNSPYPFIDERQYPGASKLGHGHAVAPTPVSQERELMSRSAAAESQMQDPYRSMLYRY